MDSLNTNQRAFVLAYVEGETMGNATKSAVKAGYSPDTADVQGSRLLRNVWVRKALDDIYDEAQAITKITKTRVMAELGRIAFSDIRAVVEWEPRENVQREADPEADQPMVVEIGNTLRLIPSEDIPTATAAAIAEISEGQHGVKVKMHPKMAALTELGRHLGIAQKIAHTGPDGTGPVQTITREMTAEQAADFYRQTLDEG